MNPKIATHSVRERGPLEPSFADPTAKPAQGGAFSATSFVRDWDALKQGLHAASELMGRLPEFHERELAVDTLVCLAAGSDRDAEEARSILLAVAMDAGTARQTLNTISQAANRFVKDFTEDIKFERPVAPMLELVKKVAEIQKSQAAGSASVPSQLATPLPGNHHAALPSAVQPTGLSSEPAVAIHPSSASAFSSAAATIPASMPTPAGALMPSVSLNSASHVLPSIAATVSAGAASSAASTTPLTVPTLKPATTATTVLTPVPAAKPRVTVAVSSDVALQTFEKTLTRISVLPESLALFQKGDYQHKEFRDALEHMAQQASNSGKPVVLRINDGGRPPNWALLIADPAPKLAWDVVKLGNSHSGFDVAAQLRQNLILQRYKQGEEIAEVEVKAPHSSAEDRILLAEGLLRDVDAALVHGETFRATFKAEAEHLSAYPSLHAKKAAAIKADVVANAPVLDKLFADQNFKWEDGSLTFSVSDVATEMSKGKGSLQQSAMELEAVFIQQSTTKSQLLRKPDPKDRDAGKDARKALDQLGGAACMVKLVTQFRDNCTTLRKAALKGTQETFNISLQAFATVLAHENEKIQAAKTELRKLIGSPSKDVAAFEEDAKALLEQVVKLEAIMNHPALSATREIIAGANQSPESRQLAKELFANIPVISSPAVKASAP